MDHTNEKNLEVGENKPGMYEVKMRFFQVVKQLFNALSDICDNGYFKTE